MMNELGYCSGIEIIRAIYPAETKREPPPTLFDYMPSDALLNCTSLDVGPFRKSAECGDRSRKETLVEYGFRLPSRLG